VYIQLNETFSLSGKCCELLVEKNIWKRVRFWLLIPDGEGGNGPLAETLLHILKTLGRLSNEKSSNLFSYHLRKNDDVIKKFPAFWYFFYSDQEKMKQVPFKVWKERDKKRIDNIESKKPSLQPHSRDFFLLDIEREEVLGMRLPSVGIAVGHTDF